MKLSKLMLTFGIIMLVFVSHCLAQNSELEKSLPNFDLMWNYNNPADTEITFKSILNDLQSRTDYDVNYKVELLSQIARAQGMQQKYSEALDTLAKAKKILREDTKSGYARYFLELGRVYNSSGDTEKAEETFMQAYIYCQDNKLDQYLMDVIHMLGILGTPEEQIKWNLQAIGIAETSQDLRVKSWLGPLYNNIGWTYHDKGEYEKALEYFQKAYDYRKTQSDETATRVAKWAIGRDYRSLKRYDDALKIQKELEAEIDSQNLPKDGYVYQEIAEIYLVQNNLEYKKYFKLAYEILSQDPWVVENQTDKLNRMKKLSE